MTGPPLAGKLAGDMSISGFEHVTIVGVGLLGGSAGLAMKAADPSVRIAGVGRRQSSLDEALHVGAIDTAHLDPAEPVGESDLVILATPVQAFAPILGQIADHLADGAVVTDVGSTKASVVAQAESIVGPERFVGSHPMAGSEQKGPAFSRADLFEGATCILTPSERTPGELVNRMETLWQALRMRTVRMAPAEHDKALAKVSHLPHAVACLLMLLPDLSDLEVSATGLRDTTRLASGDPEMWRDIFLTNADAVLAAAEGLADLLNEFRDLVDDRDAEGLRTFLASAKIRRDSTIAQSLADRRIAME
ncbi:MAG: prephenate dehydrogenase [Planctomycetota bacterium]